MKKLIGSMAGLLLFLGVWAPETAAVAAGEALQLCTHTLIPSLFPFFVCSNLFVASGLANVVGSRLERPFFRLFGIRGAGVSAILLGFCSGYPSGAAVAARLYLGGQISKSEAHRLLAFTNNPSPLFVLGVIGTGVYGHAKAGYLLLSAIVLSSVFTGICMRTWGGKGEERRGQKKTRLSDPMEAAIGTALRLCGFVIFFAVVAAFSERTGLLPLIRRALIQFGCGEKTAAMLVDGILEVSALSGKAGALPAMAGLLSLGGVSVFLQVWDIARRAGLSVRSFLVGKLLSGGFAALFCRLMLLFVPVTTETAVSGEKIICFGAYLGIVTLGSVGLYAIFRVMQYFRDKKRQAV